MHFIYSSWKARGWLSVRHNWKIFALLRLRRYKRKYVEVGVFRMGRVTFSANFRQKGASHTNRSWCQSNSDCPFVRYQNNRSTSFSFVTIHACDGRTDGREWLKNTSSEFMFAQVVQIFSLERWDNKSPFDSILFQQQFCQKLPKSVDVRWNFSVQHQCCF